MGGESAKARLSDDEIYEIATRIRDAVHGHTCGRLPDILAQRYELSPPEEDRVVVALAVLDALEDVPR